MAVTARAPIRRTLAAGVVRMRLVVLFAMLTGLVTMHQLAGAAPLPEHRHATGHAASAADGGVAADRAATSVPTMSAIRDPGHVSPSCPPGDTDCPDRPHGHPGHVCQLGSPGSAPAVPAPALTPLPGALPPDPAELAAGVARDAAAGTGCGPPSRAELAVWRI